jgi:hypothetical protein
MKNNKKKSFYENTFMIKNTYGQLSPKNQVFILIQKNMKEKKYIA